MAKPPSLRIEAHFEISHLSHELLVECPSCRLCARRSRPSYDRPKRKFGTHISCLHCAAQHDMATDRDDWNQLPLWSKTNCCGGGFVGAERQAPGGFGTIFGGGAARE